MKKKLLAMLLLVAVATTMFACGGKNNAKDEPKTPATILQAQFLATAEKADSLENLANDLVNNDAIEFGPAVMVVEEGYLNGFNDEITGFSEGVMFGPMIGSIPFVGYVFTVDGDVDGFKKQLEEKHDLRWNICTEADEMVCDSVGNKVFFVMAPEKFED